MSSSKYLTSNINSVRTDTNVCFVIHVEGVLYTCTHEWPPRETVSLTAGLTTQTSISGLTLTLNLLFEVVVPKVIIQIIFVDFDASNEIW